ncbi:MAG: DUF1549 and DUF1553 domain-containing protein [Fuerstiella sp.]|nr:DUF1549 and DUF1553 domain-containing protein [Fuerstiella sp.]
MNKRIWRSVAAVSISASFFAGIIVRLPAETSDIAPGIRYSDEVTAADRQFWSFQRLSTIQVPQAANVDRVRTPVDNFVLRRLENEGLSFSPDADPSTLLRRVYLDLTGLLPSPTEVDALLVQLDTDDTDAVFDQLIDRLLSSPQFGERWGRHWLDVAGFVDILGSDENATAIRISPGKWKYRDYVIRAFNEDKPYDRFLTEQLAGDELVDWRTTEAFTPEIKELLVATGFLRLAIDDTNQAVLDIPSNRHATIYDTLQMLGTSLLGITLQCAQCHSHKFDPIPHRDYYQLMSLLTPAYNPDRWVPLPERDLADISPQRKARWQEENAELDRRVSALEQKKTAIVRPLEQRILDRKLVQVPEEMREDVKQALLTPAGQRNETQRKLARIFEANVQPTQEEVQEELTAEDRVTVSDLNDQMTQLQGQRRTWGVIQAMYDTGPPQKRHIYEGGSYEEKGEEVSPGFLTVLSQSDQVLSGEKSSRVQGETSGRRLSLAEWVTRPDSAAAALAARVMVNRIWQHLFGRGIVDTPGNLGMGGTPPTHPELIDWLAQEFVRGDWRIKPIIRVLMSSTVYRQASFRPPHFEVPEVVAYKTDPTNKLLWRMRLRRLESEIIRDTILCASDKLDLSMGGPPLPQKVLPGEEFVVATEDLPANSSPFRRSVYLLCRRNYSLTFFSVFDHPMMATNCHQRNHSAGVLQSLTMLNDDFVMEQADAVARRVFAADPRDIGEAIDLTYRLILVRSPTQQEFEWSKEFLHEHMEGYRTSEVAVGDPDRNALSGLCHVLLNSSQFLYIE